jgi:Protein of unknown function (DUF3072)
MASVPEKQTPHKNEAGTIFQVQRWPFRRFDEQRQGGHMADNTQKDPKDWISGDDPMTGAQASYLKTLSEQADKPDPTGKPMTKAEASELIDRMRDKAGLE